MKKVYHGPLQIHLLGVASHLLSLSWGNPFGQFLSVPPDVFLKNPSGLDDIKKWLTGSASDHHWELQVPQISDGKGEKNSTSHKL